ncbi:MAG: hypothetical protein IT479_14705 [Xanthomonadales bacterium]|nr:hypothetical protein [Xanthomonadales bacterium]
MGNPTELRTGQIGTRTVAVALLAVGGWLAWAAATVNIESEDGYGTLSNVPYFLGERTEHSFNGGPLPALLLIPAQLLVRALELHPLDVRPAHLTMAIAVLCSLAASWSLLARIHGRDGVSALAWLAALLTPVFASYAPFISFDIAPAVLVLWMLYLVDRHMQVPSVGRWVLLALVGAILPMLKQTYALLWVAIVLAMPLALRLGGEWRLLRKRYSTLCSAAVVSGVLTWLCYGLALAVPYTDSPWWIRPWLQIQAISGMYDKEGGAAAVFAIGTYARNLWAYGPLCVALLLPGLAMALRRGSRLERLIALSWLFLVLALHWTSFKEVRYLAFLAPLNAVLCVRPLRGLLALGTPLRALMLAGLLAGLTLTVLEAMRLSRPYYRHAVLDFLEPLPVHAQFQGSIFGGDPLSFVAPEPGAFFADRYHRITHLMPATIAILYGYRSGSVRQLRSTLDFGLGSVRAGDFWMLTSGLVVRQKPFRRGNLEGLDRNYFKILARAEWLELLAANGGYRLQAPADQPFVLVGRRAGTAPRLVEGHIDQSVAAELWGWQATPARPRVLAFRVLRRCGLHDCRRFD